jgi:hypothetical protein
LRHAEPSEGPALDLEEAAHAAARYVVRAVGASAPAIDRVLARRSRGAAVAPAG